MSRILLRVASLQSYIFAQAEKSTFTATTAPSEAFGLWHLNDFNEVLTYNGS